VEEIASEVGELVINFAAQPLFHRRANSAGKTLLPETRG